MARTQNRLMARWWLVVSLSVGWLVAGVEAVPVRVATFNVENGIAEPGTPKYEAAKATLLRIDADVVAFQELRRSSPTVAWEQHWQQLAAELGYLTAFGPDGTTMSGSHRMGYFSRFPIREVAHVRSPPGASEMTRLPMRIVLEVPGAAKPLVLWNMHHKANEGTDPVLLERNQFRRAVEAIRIVQDIDAYRLANPDHDEFVVLGDLNADVFTEPQQLFFQAIPSGLPSSYTLGSDITFPVAYRFFPDDVYEVAGGGMRRLDAFQVNSTVRHTFPSWPSVLDYIIVSTALYQSSSGSLVGEVYNSQRDVQFPNFGLPKAGAPPLFSTSSTASDHLPVFVDLQMADAVTAVLGVSPEGVWSPSGLPGGPFSPLQQTYTLSNPTAGPLAWTAQVNVPWLQLSAASGTVPVGGAVSVVATVNPTQAPTEAGNYFGAIEWTDLATGDRQTRAVVLSVLAPGRLSITPDGERVVAGPPGGPFNPSSTVLAVSNPGQSAVAWSVGADAPWVTLSGTGGTLAPGASVNVSVTVNAAASALAEGVYGATLTFTDGNSGSVTTRALRLDVRFADYFTRQYTSGINLAGQSLTFAPDGSGNHYLLRREAASAFPSNPVGGTVLTLSDDSFVGVNFPDGTLFPFFGEFYERVFVGSNGYLTFGAGDSSFSVSLSNHFRLPRISAVYTDLNPAAGGQVSQKEWPDRLAITFVDVPEFGRGNRNSFQIELFFDGRIRLTFLRIDAPAGIVGLSRGAGQPVDFTSSNFLSAATTLAEPWGRPLVLGVEVGGARLSTFALASDLGVFSEHGYVLALADRQPLPALGDPSSGAIDFAGPPPDNFDVWIEGLQGGLSYAVRAYAVRGGEIFYSVPTVFTTRRAGSGDIYYETGFEDVSKGSYAAGPLTSAGLVWMFDNTMIGAASGDVFNGTKAARMRNGKLEMLGWLDRGVGSVSFLYARSNFSGDRGANPPTFVVEYATGANPEQWTAVGAPVSLAGVDDLTRYTAQVDVPGQVRLRIRQVQGDATRRWNIDDFAVTTFTEGGGSGPVVIGGDLFADGRVGEPFAFRIPVQGPAQFFEMEAVPAGLLLDTQTGMLSGTPTVAGEYELTVVAGNAFGGDSATLILDVARGLPSVLAPPTAEPLAAGRPLSEATLSGGESDRPGTFAFADPNFVPPSGQTQQVVLFVPDDGVNYDTVSLLVNVIVENQAVAAEVFFGDLQRVYRGTPQPVEVFTVPEGLAVEVTYDGGATPPTEAGLYNVQAVVADPGYLGSANGTLVIDRATPEIAAAPRASSLVEGQNLGQSFLTDGAAEVEGVFLFAQPELVPEVGESSRAVLFVPNDTRNYTTVSLLVPVEVKAVLPEGPVVAAWSMAGRAGNQALTPGGAPEGVVALPLVRGAGLVPASAVNSMSSSAWSNAEAPHYSFGFSTGEGHAVALQDLRLALRASPSGPGRLALRWSVDDFAADLATWTQGPDQALSQIIDLSGRGPLTGTVEFRIVAVGETSASGGSTAAAGTLRIANYAGPGGDSGWFGLTGEVQSSERIISPLAVQTRVGDSFAYTVEATGSPLNFSAENLPDGLQIDVATGVIAGTPVDRGTYAIALAAGFAAGPPATATLVLSVLGPPGQNPLEDWLEGESLTPALLESYAVGGASRRGQPGEWPRVGQTADELSLTVVVREDDPRLAVTAEAADQLGPAWSGSAVQVRGRGQPGGPSQDGVPPGFERRIYAVPVNDGEQRFLRLRISYD